MARRLVSAFAAAAALTLSPVVPAHAEAIGIRMFVPTFCQAGLVGSEGEQAGNVRNLGLLREACNSANGYTVMVQTPEGLTDAVFVLSGDNGVERIPVSQSGFTILTASDAPGRKARQLSLELHDADQPLPWVSVSTIVG